MADAQPPDQKEAKGSSSIVRTIVVLGITILVPAITALVLFLFVIKPMLAPKEPVQVQEPTDTIPVAAVTIEFDETQVTVLTDNAAGPAPLLVYQVAMACSDAETMAVVEAKKTWFSAMLNRLHRNKTRSELNDPAIQEAILRQSKQEANELLKKLAPETKGQIIEVMYLKYTIVDL